MKRFTLVLTFAALLAATTAHAITWQKTFEGGNGYCVQETSDSNYIITGRRSSDLWLFKTDTLGIILWEYTLEGGSGKWVEETGDGFIVGGNPDLLKTDEWGDSSWAKDFGIVSRCVRRTSDDGYIVAGSYTYDQLALVKTNSEGDTLWIRTHEESGHNLNRAYFVSETMDSGFIIAGETGLSSEELEARWLWLVKTDAQGNVLWTKMYAGTETGNFENRGRCVRQTMDKGYIVTGSRDPGGFWLLKTDENGDTLWTVTYGEEYGRSVLETPEGDYVAVGRGPAANPWLASYDAGDVLLVKADAYGNTIWERHHGGDDVDVGECVDQTSDGGYIITGWSGSFLPSGLYLLKTDSLGFMDAIVEKPIAELPITWVVLSPVGTGIVLQYHDRPQGFQAAIFDVSGRRVDQIHATGSSGIVSWGSNQVPGVYFIQVNETNNTRTEKVVIIH